MRGRRGLAEAITKEEFVEMYTSGMSLQEIGEKLGAREITVREFFLENFLGFERYVLKNKHIKSRGGGDAE